MFVYVRYCSVRNTKFSQQYVESPKFLSLHEYFSNSKPMFPSLLKLTMPSLQFRTKRRSKFACSKISSSMSAMLFAKNILPRAKRACTFDNSADRNVWLQPALRSFAIVCDYMETVLFAIVGDLRSAIRDRLRSYGNQP